MAGKDYKTGKVDFSNTSVEVLLTSAANRQAEAALPKAERKRTVKERRREEERKPRRLHVDFPLEIKERLVRLAEREGVPVSQLITFLLIEPLERMENTSNPLWGYMKISRCARYDSFIDVDKRLKEVQNEKKDK